MRREYYFKEGNQLESLSPRRRPVAYQGGDSSSCRDEIRRVKRPRDHHPVCSISAVGSRVARLGVWDLHHSAGLTVRLHRASLEALVMITPYWYCTVVQFIRDDMSMSTINNYIQN